MFKLGQIIKILDIPDHTHWGIPDGLRGLHAVVIESERTDYNGIPCFKLRIREPGNSNNHGEWYFPRPEVSGCANLYELSKDYRWNPMGYKPRFEPLKLP